MTRHRFAPIICGLVLAACVTPEDPFTSLTTAASLTLTTASTMDGETGDGDGDGGTSGDGDGDTGDGDGDTGDGDGDTGDGDGDGDTGDGDGDGDTGDGDGDTGNLPANCGWNAGGNPAGYYCGFMGEDPGGQVPIACPPGLVENDPCGDVTGAGCCDENGDNWYCGDDGMGNQFLVLEAC